MCRLLKIFSEVLKVYTSFFLKKIVVLKAAFHSNPISNFKHLQRKILWGNLQIFRRVLLLSRYF